ncbi:hypothetical protein [Micromonospora radicis]|uniref:Uncharacterized protein n=1 Tax=Micromonospora radicis TaxID=1894971 RepID=A0A418MYR1_9ACTN|nr:hypothetical protein [Micromonospora radicis]RIV40360.1 hypothetical protein D2L64_05875 [Micromonospora radicis]
MIDKVLTLLPGCEPEFASGVVGRDYFRSAHRTASLRLFEASVEQRSEEGDRVRAAEVVPAIVPVLDNDYNEQALAVILPDADGAVRLENQVGWLPDRRCATLQPRVVSLMRATNAYVGAAGTASYWWSGRSWDKSDARLRLRIAQWEDVHRAAIEITRRAEPDVEQPWVGHYAPLTDLARRWYAQGRGRSEADLLHVRYEIIDDALVATVDGEIVTDMTRSGRDFFDPLRARVEQQGPVWGWVRLHRGAVEVRAEELP